MKQVFTLLLLLFFIRGRAQTNYFPPTNNSTWDTLSPTQLNWCSSSIDSLNNYLQSTKTDAFIILKNGKIVLEKYFGTFTQDSIHYWASAGKSLTAMITGIAQQKGMLNINDSASKYLGTGWTSETPAKEKLITIKHLLTMTGGMNDSPAL
ncbi:MAG TPA: serine hydrolase domain-containing protein, partial [Chitinophagales bacterium]|nr:serine hydrolase domain-containing protein [Chitinophagales bacterium]